MPFMEIVGLHKPMFPLFELFFCSHKIPNNVSNASIGSIVQKYKQLSSKFTLVSLWLLASHELDDRLIHKFNSCAVKLLAKFMPCKHSNNNIFGNMFVKLSCFATLESTSHIA